VCGYPCEPVLAEASAFIMKEYPTFSPDKLIECLVNEMKTGAVQPGFRGELVSKLLLQLSKDSLMDKWSTDFCTVEKFLDVLL
jgi:hypothetical protein